MSRPHIIILLLASSIINCLAAPPSYYPAGPQTDVPETDLKGWKKCWSNSYRDEYSYDTNATRIYEECSGSYLLYGCRKVDSTNITLLAAGAQSVLTNFTGYDYYSVNNDNGVDWYFNLDQSVGFAYPNDSIIKDNCDYINGDYPQYKLCWHASENGFYSGYRCGEAMDISIGWIREIWIPDPCGNRKEGEECDDGNACTIGTTCTAGVCGGGTPKTCGPCKECDPILDCVPLNNGTSCSDEDLCTNNDTCQAGFCIGELAVTCDTPQGCFNSTCSPLTGQCEAACPEPVAAPVTAPTAAPLKAPSAKTSGSEQLMAFIGLVLALVASLI